MSYLCCAWKTSRLSHVFLFHMSLLYIKSSRLINKIIVSTDSLKIKRIWFGNLFLHFPPYLTTRAPRALKKKILIKLGTIWQSLVQIGLNWTHFRPFFRFDMFFAELTSLGANYSTPTVHAFLAHRLKNDKYQQSFIKPPKYFRSSPDLGLKLRYS